MSKANKVRFDTQPQLTRLHGLVQRIRRGDYPSQKVLAEEWSKTTRTIQSDLDYIRDMWGLPLEYEPRRYGYYFREPVANFPMVVISERELVSVFIAQKALRLYHGTAFERPLKGAFEKLAGSLEGEISVAWEELDAAISFRGIEANPADAETFQRLSGAVRSRNEIEFEYQKLGSARYERRRVRPYHLASIGNQWYLFGYDLMRRAVRRFVPTRMRGLRVRGERFERPKDFSVEKELRGSFGVFSGGEKVEMKIWFDSWVAQLVRERRWHRSQRIRELAGGEIELSLELSSFVEVVPWILSWGSHARAVAPEGLVAEVKAVVGKLGEMYG